MVASLNRHRVSQEHSVGGDRASNRVEISTCVIRQAVANSCDIVRVWQLRRDTCKGSEAKESYTGEPCMRSGCGSVAEIFSIGHGCVIAVVGAARTRTERYARCPVFAVTRTERYARCPVFAVTRTERYARCPGSAAPRLSVGLGVLAS